MAEDNKLANPGVLGLTCFGMTTFLLNLHNAGIFKMDASILAMGLFLGGSVQIIAGILEYKRSNTFGLTAFCCYGAFWLTLCFIIIAKPYMATKVGLEMSDKGFAWYLALWGLFTLLMFFPTLKLDRVLQFVFLSLVALYTLLAIGFGWGFTGVIKAAGVVGLACGASAIYHAQAELWNEVYGKKVLPLWPAT
ncbi:MAG: acetate uptake transporter [Actinomycetota bacterium]|nr:acetate uptake transporter [Actinomycetota bacterium]